MFPGSALRPYTAKTPASRTTIVADISLEANDHSVPSNSPSPSSARLASERSARRNALLRDFVLGFSDGLTVPFALTAGLSTLGSTRLVVVGGIAELFAGAISMGMSTYLASTTEQKHFEVEEARQWRGVTENTEKEGPEMLELLDRYGIKGHAAEAVMAELKKDAGHWVKVYPPSVALSASSIVLHSASPSMIYSTADTYSSKSISASSCNAPQAKAPGSRVW